MFNACDFVFAGRSSSMYDLMIYDFDGKNSSDTSFGNQASIIETRTSRRIQPIHYGVDYNRNPLEHKIVFGSLRPLSRFEMEEIALWLTGYQTYQWLSILQEDMFNMHYKCLITQLTPITYDWIPYAFEATIRCDCPYAYGDPFEYSYTLTSSSSSITFVNESSVREYLKPVITYTPSGSGTRTLSITNTSDGNRASTISGITNSMAVVIDSGLGIITETVSGTNLYGNFNYNFPRFIQGTNVLTASGAGTLRISGRFLHNIAG